MSRNGPSGFLSLLPCPVYIRHSACVSLSDISTKVARVIPGIYTANITTEAYDDDDRAKLQFLLLLVVIINQRGLAGKGSAVYGTTHASTDGRVRHFFFMIMKSFRVKCTYINTHPLSRWRSS